MKILVLLLLHLPWYPYKVGGGVVREWVAVVPLCRTITISVFALRGVTGASGPTTRLSYRVCGHAGTAYSASGCQFHCNVPPIAGYLLTSAGRTVAISGFAPSGVTCGGGYIGSVSYSACGQAGTAYSASGSQAGIGINETIIWDE